MNRLATLLGRIIALIGTFCLNAVFATPFDAGSVTGTIRVACCGDSITEGITGVDGPPGVVWTYPAQLDRMLSTNWNVQNFGVGGRCVCTNGAFPYINTTFTGFTGATNFLPHVVIIKLGTNDSHTNILPDNATIFFDSYTNLIAIFKNLSTHPKIYLCRPIPAYSGLFSITNSVITNYTIPYIDQVAAATGCDVIDLYLALDGCPMMYDDGIHPNEFGQRTIAQTVYQALKGQPPPDQPPIGDGYVWTGAAGDGLWSSSNNWATTNNWGTTNPTVNHSAPSPTRGDAISFTDLGLNLTNRLDQDYCVKSLYFAPKWTNQPTVGLGTVIDLGGHSLIVSNGQMRIGYLRSDVRATIRNGTLQIGTTNAKVTVYTSYFDRPASLQYSTIPGYTDTICTISATVDVRNVGTLWVAGNPSVYGSAEGLLDLSSATLNCGTEQNMLRLDTLVVGGNNNSLATSINGRDARGTLRLPSTLRAIEVGTLRIGVGTAGTGTAAPSIGTVEFPSNSALQSLTVTNELLMGSHDAQLGRIGYTNETGFVDGLPTGVVLHIGQTNALARMYVGYNLSTFSAASTGRLIMTQGRFESSLSELRIGVNDSSYNIATGLVDLSSSTLVSGGETNAFKLDVLRVGSTSLATLLGGCNAYGTLRLPPSLRKLEIGTLWLGAGNGPNGTKGELDIGLNSSLQILKVTNAFLLGAYGAQYGRIGTMSNGSWVNYLPTGVVWTVGQANSYAPLIIGHQSGQNAMSSGTVVLAQGTFTGYLSQLRVGINDYDNGYGSAFGLLNLSNSSLVALTVTGDVQIANSRLKNNFKGKGFVYLPAGTATIQGSLLIGDNTNFASSATDKSQGLLELFGTRVSVGSNVVVETTGVISNHVYGSSCGIDILCAGTNYLSMSNAARVVVDFKDNPTDTSTVYWGLRMKGNQQAYLQGLMNSAKIIILTNGLSGINAQQCGVYYDSSNDVTYIGVPPTTTSQGTSLIWLANYSLSTDMIDDDGDGMATWQEYIAGTDPTNRNSVLGMYLRTDGFSSAMTGIVVQWWSSTGKYYRLDRSTDLTAIPMFDQVITSRVAAIQPMNTVTDITATGDGPYFYRVAIVP